MIVRRIVSGTAVGGLLLASAVAGPAAQAVDPPGTIILASGLSAFAAHGRIASAAASGVVLTYGPASASGGEGDPFASEIFLPATGAAVPLDSSVQWNVQGSMLTAQNYSTGPEVKYRNVSGTVRGTAAIADSDVYSGSTPTGWVVTRDVTVGASRTTHVILTNATTLVSTDLGPIPGLDPALGSATVSTGPNGLTVEASTDSVTHWYVTYAAPNSFVQLLPATTAFTCAVTAVGTNAAAWIESPDGGVSTQLVRVQLGNKAVQVTPLAASYCGGTVAVTPTQTGVRYSGTTSDSLTTVAATGGAVQTRTDLVSPTYTGMASEGSNFLVGNGITPTTAGVYKLASAAAAPQLVRLWGVGALAADAIAVGPGRAGWVDNSATGIPAWSRTLTSAGNGLTAGAPSLVASHATTFGLSISGQRTLFVTNDSVDGGVAKLWLRAGGSPPVLLVTGATGIATAAVSGTRVVYSDYAGVWNLIDLVKGTTKKLPKVLVGSYALSGNSLAVLRDNGSVWWQDVTKGTWVAVAAAPLPAGAFDGGTVAVAGDEVAWRRDSCGDTGCASLAAHRNARTLSPVIDLPAAGSTAKLALSANYVAFADYSLGQLLTTSLSSGVTSVVVGATPYRFALSGSTVGWFGADGLPRVTPLAPLPDRPRYLGNGFAPTVLAVGQLWTADLVTSAVLTTCQVTIKKGATVVRTLSCDAGLMAQGEAVATWDGKDGAGAAVPLAKYTWSITAGNVDGSVLAANGSSTAISGPVTVQ